MMVSTTAALGAWVCSSTRQGAGVLIHPKRSPTTQGEHRDGVSTSGKTERSHSRGQPNPVHGGLDHRHDTERDGRSAAESRSGPGYAADRHDDDGHGGFDPASVALHEAR